MPKTVGERIRAARLKGGYSQKELAGYANCAPNTVYRIEAGRIKDPSGATLQRIAEVLRSSVDELLGRKA